MKIPRFSLRYFLRRKVRDFRILEKYADPNFSTEIFLLFKLHNRYSTLYYPYDQFIKRVNFKSFKVIKKLILMVLKGRNVVLGSMQLKDM